LVFFVEDEALSNAVTRALVLLSFCHHGDGYMHAARIFYFLEENPFHFRAAAKPDNLTW